MNETDTSLQLYAVCFFCADERMLTGADRLLGGESAAMSCPPRSSGMKRVSQQRCSAAMHQSVKSSPGCFVATSELRTRCPFVTECGETLAFLGGRLFRNNWGNLDPASCFLDVACAVIVFRPRVARLSVSKGARTSDCISRMLQEKERRPQRDDQGR